MLKRCLLGITKAASLIGIAAFLFYSGYAYTKAPGLLCLTAKQQITKLYATGYSLAGTAISSNIFVVQLYIKSRTREWVMIGIDHDKNSCELLHGENWMLPLEHEI